METVTGPKGRAGAAISDEREFLARGSDVTVPSGDGHGRTWRMRPDVPVGTVGERIAESIRSAMATEAAFGTPFLFVPVLIGAGAATYFLLPAEPRAMPLVLGAGLLGFFAVLARNFRVLAGTLLAAILFLGGMAAAKLQCWRLDTPMLASPVNTTLTGRIVEIERMRSGRIRLTLDVISTRRPALRHAPARVRASTMRIPADLSPGSIVEGRLRLLPLQGPVRPGGYDFSFHAYFDGVGATGFFLGSPKPVAAQRPAGGAARWRLSIEVLRHRLTERIRERLQGPEGELAAALITGAQAGIPETVNEALRRSGLAHILSISGLHMALVAGTVMAALRLAFACFPVFASRYPVRKFAAGAALAVLCLYLFISGAAVATVRSAIMLAVMLVAVIADRPAITMRSLAVAALIILAIHPHEVTDPGFQMSFAATAALIAAYRAWADRSRFRRRGAAEPDRSGPGALLARLLLAVAGLAATSFVAGAATGIFGIWHFHRVAPFGLAANLAAMPVVSMAVMPLALVSVLLIPFDLDGPAFGLLGGSIAVVVEIAEGFSQLTAYDTVGAISAWTLIAASLGLILATLPAGRLKLCALPCLAAAAFGVSSRNLPDLLVSEDARLVAIRREDGRLAVNRERPEAFTIGVWSRAAAATAGLTGPKAGRGPLDSAPAMDGRSGPAFQCEAGLCAARLADGAIIVHAADAGTARGACAYAFMIVVAEAVPAERICKGGKSLPGPAVAGHPPARGGRDEARNRRNRKPARHVERQGSPAERETGNGPIVLTAIDLARRGAMELRLQASDSGTERPALPSRKAPVLRFAIGLPWRPWHAHRAWSREARGLPPYVPPQGASRRTSPVPPAGKL